MALSRIDIASDILRAIAAGDADTAAAPISPDRFVQHDPGLADGIAGLRERIGGRSRGEGSLEIARALEDGALVVAQGREGEEVFFAVFRFEGDLVAEHWRFAAPVAPPNASGHTQTDGPPHPDGRQDTERSKALVRDYYETVHIAGRHDRIGHYMAGDRQVRHEPGVRDGVAAFRRDLETLTRSRTIDAIALLVGQGDLVFIAARGTHEGRPCAYLDLYRVEADRLVEHWGFPQEIPPATASRNAHGML